MDNKLSTNKLKDKFSNLLIVIFGCAFGLIFLINTFSPASSVYGRKIDYNILAIIIGTVMGSLLLMNCKNYIYSSSTKRLMGIVALCFVFTVAIQMIFINNFSVITYVDEKHLYAAAVDIKNGDTISNMSYFSDRYPFQLPITLIMACIFKLCDIFNIADYETVLSAVNTLFINASMLLTFIAAVKIFDIRRAVLALVLLVLNPVTYIYTVYFYTDIPAIFFLVLCLNLYLMCIEKKGGLRYLYAMLLGVSAYLGYMIRATVILAVIAIIVHMLFTRKIREVIAVTAIIVVIFVSASEGYGHLEKQFITEEIVGLPTVHWIHMGMNLEKGGQFNLEDRNFALQFKAHDERVAAVTRALADRVNENGFLGAVELVFIKIFSTWTKPADFYTQDYMERYSSLYPYIFGERADFFLYYAHIYKSVLMLLVFAAALRFRKGKYRDIDFANVIYLLGFFAFYLIWECKARYMLLAYPAMILCGINGVEHLSEKATGIAANFLALPLGEGNKKINTKTAAVAIMVIVPLLTIGISAYYYDTYTNENVSQYSWISKQDNSNGSAKEIPAGEEIVQSFVASKDFNCIDIYVKMPESGLTAEYTATLTRLSDSREIKSWRISRSDISDNTIKLRLSSSVNTAKKPETYSIRIKAESISKDGSLQFLTYHYHNYDVFPSGTLMLCNELLDDTDLKFCVYGHIKAPLISSAAYIVAIALILMAELSVLYIFQRDMRKHVLH